MSNPQNISAVDVSITEPQKYFNNLYLNPGTITGNQNDAIVAFFERQTKGNKEAARILASAIIYTSIAQNLDPMSIIQQFTELPPGQLNSYLTMFLNLNRIGTSYLGINNQPAVNKYIKRAILI